MADNDKPSFVKVDLTLHIEDGENHYAEILNIVRPAWNLDDVRVKVGIVELNILLTVF